MTFFSHSRLSWIGSWADRWVDLLDSLEEEHGGEFFAAALPADSSEKGARVVLHVDLDAFFASVSLMDRPAELRERPVVICWSTARDLDTQLRSDSEISCPNYAARKLGIRAGMFLRTAKQLCEEQGAPVLEALPFEFDKYETVAEEIWRMLFRVTRRIEGVSCDEAFLDVTDLVRDLGGDPRDAPRRVVDNIQSMVRNRWGGAITCSVGIGPTKVLARLATGLAKKTAGPGSCHEITPDEAVTVLAPLPADALHGIGRRTMQSLAELLKKQQPTVGDVQGVSKSVLQGKFGPKMGENIYHLARGGLSMGYGEEPWTLRPKRTSMSKQSSWGVRATCDEDAIAQLHEYVGLLVPKMEKRGIRAKMVKVRVWVAVVNQPANWRKGTQGHGLCDVFEDSLALREFTAEVHVLNEAVGELFRRLRSECKFQATETMGLGVVVTQFADGTTNSTTTTTTTRLAPKRERLRHEFVNDEMGVVRAHQQHQQPSSTTSTTTTVLTRETLMDRIIHQIQTAGEEEGEANQLALVYEILQHELVRAFQETKSNFLAHDQAVREAVHWVTRLSALTQAPRTVVEWALFFVRDRWDVTRMPSDDALVDFSARGSSTVMFEECLLDVLQSP